MRDRGPRANEVSEGCAKMQASPNQLEDYYKDEIAKRDYQIRELEQEVLNLYRKLI